MSGVLGNRLVGILHGCLRHHSPYNEHTASAHRMPAADDNLRTWDVYRKTSHASLMRSALCVLLVSGCEAA